MNKLRIKTECYIKRKEYIGLLEIYTGLKVKDIPYDKEYDIFKAYNKDKGFLGIELDKDFLDNYMDEDYSNDREENTKLMYYKLNYPYEFYVAYFKIYYPTYTLKNLVNNKDKYLNKEIVDDNYDLERAARTINEALLRNIKLDNLDSLSLEGIIGLTSKKLLQKVKLMLQVKNKLLYAELKEAINLTTPLFKYYKKNYEILSKYIEYVIDEIDFIEYKLIDKNDTHSILAKKKITKFKDKIYKLN